MDPETGPGPGPASQPNPEEIPIPGTPMGYHVGNPQTSVALETDSMVDQTISWSFDGPLATSFDTVTVASNESNKWFEAAKRRREVKADKALSARRDALLVIAENVFDRSNAPAFRALSRVAEGHFRDEMALLDSVLLAHPCQVPESNEVGYCLEKWKYDRLQELLSRLSVDRQSVLRNMNLSSPSIPSLPLEWPINSLWGVKDLEVLCVALREDVENFLAFYWDIVAKTRGTWKPSKDEEPSPSFPEAEEVSSNPVVFQMRYVAARKVLQRKLTADASFNEARVRITSENLAPEHGDHPHSLSRIHPGPIQAYSGRELIYLPKDDMDDNLPIDHGQVRRRQSTAYNSGPRPSVIFNSPYNQKPTNLTGSDGLEEMFKTPAHARRRTIFSIPETSESPKRTYGVTGGAPPPRDDPPDDEDSSDSSPSPTPYPPRFPAYPPSGRGNPPGRPSGSGPPDSGPPDDDGGNGGSPNRGDRNPNGRRESDSPSGQSKLEAYFDNKLRPETVPEWDGNPDTLAQWILKVNHLAQRSNTVFSQLGEIIPLRLRKGAERWFFSLPLSYRQEATLNWKTIRDVIGAYYMNRARLDIQKARATRAAFREPGHSSESPSEYT